MSNTQDQCMQQFVKLCPIASSASFPFPVLSDIPDIISKTNNLFTTLLFLLITGYPSAHIYVRRQLLK